MATEKAEALSEADAEETILRWRNDPVAYVVERLGTVNVPDIPHQVRLLRALPECILDRKPLVVPSGHAMGKDFLISGRGTLWFVECFAPCKVIMTGPTDRQVREIMWAELEKAYNNRVIKDAFGRMITCKLDLAEDWCILAFTTKETGEGAGKFQGAHSPRIMIVVSEAQKVEEKIYDQIDGLTTSGIVLQCYLGNPLRTTGRFAKMIRDTSNNRVMNLNCYESPNVIHKREIVPGLCSHFWVEDKEKKWNADGSKKDPRYRARVLGLLPNTSINTVFSEELYESCVNKTIIESVQRGCVVADPARFGDDDMVIKAFKNGREIDRKALPKCDAVEGAGEIILMQKKHFPDGQIVIGADCDGLGGPYLDIAKKMVSDQLEIVWLEFHGSCNDREIVGADFENHRAESAFYAQEQMEAGRVCLTDNEACKEEALGDEYFVNSHGRMQLIDKEDIKESIGRSPNDWDCSKLAIWALKFAPIMKPKGSGWRDRTSPRGSSMVPANKSGMMGA